MATAPELQLPVCMQSFYIVKRVNKWRCDLQSSTSDKRGDKTSRHASYSP